jgi:hypothetical protein
LVEVKAQPIIVHEHSHVAVCLSDVLYEGGLSLAQDPDEHTHKVGCFVHVDYHTLVDLAEGLTDLRSQLQTALLYLFVLSDVVYVGVSQLVGL